MPTKLIVVNGIAEHGKDSFVKYARRKFKGLTYNHSTVSTVKKAAKLFGADEDIHKGDAERRLWSDMKDAYTRYCDGPFREIINRVDEIDSLFPDDPALVFAHVREPEEIQKLKNHFKERCLTLVVTRDENTHIPDNHADQCVLDFEYDFQIKNNGTLQNLKCCARSFIQNLEAHWN